MTNSFSIKDNRPVHLFFGKDIPTINVTTEIELLGNTQCQIIHCKTWAEVAENFKLNPVGITFAVCELEHITINDNYPVVVGITLYIKFAFLDESNYVVEKESESSFFGYHAVTIVGYDLEKQEFLVKNSFGNTWGMKGYFIMPFEYAKTEIFERWIFDIPNPKDSKILVE